MSSLIVLASLGIYLHGALIIFEHCIWEAIVIMHFNTNSRHIFLVDSKYEAVIAQVNVENISEYTYFWMITADAGTPIKIRLLYVTMSCKRMENELKNCACLE